MAVVSSCPIARRCAGILCYAGALGALCVAVTVIIRGVEPINTAEVLRYVDEEFERLNGTCTVIAVRKCMRTTSDANPPDTLLADRDENGAPHCWSSYTPRFSLDPAFYNGAREFNAYPEFILERVGECPADSCENDARLMPSGAFQSGGAYPCFRPMAARVDVRYECGNAPCYKLRDPATLVAAATEEATRVYYFGGGLALGGILLGCISLCVWPPSGLSRRSTALPDVAVLTGLPVHQSKRRPSDDQIRRGRAWDVEDETKKPLTPPKPLPPPRIVNRV